MSRMVSYAGMKNHLRGRIYGVNAIKNENDRWVINRTEGEGVTFVGNLQQSERLVVDMPYVGEDSSMPHSSQGWLRDRHYYFEKLSEQAPECMSEDNLKRIQAHTSPEVDEQFVRSFPEYAGFEGQTLIHHHIGEGCEAVAIPSSLHSGYSGIHDAEKAVGINENAQRFTDYYKESMENNPTLSLGDVKDSYLQKFRSESATASQTLKELGGEEEATGQATGTGFRDSLLAAGEDTAAPRNGAFKHDLQTLGGEEAPAPAASEEETVSGFYRGNTFISDPEQVQERS